MLNEEKIREIKLKKKQGALNSTLMKEHNITYAQLKSILEEKENI